jgi:hypothetical protein
MAINKISIAFFDMFLQQNGCLEKFYNNQKKEPICEFNYIDGAFVWYDTEEGFDFWRSINQKWKSLLTNVNNFDIKVCETIQGHQLEYTKDRAVKSLTFLSPNLILCFIDKLAKGEY